ncbi:MAG: glutamine amidotransferase [Proteobacteria bacterium]|nr:glutamine amidotransferase [Pseudomonadota bacterium]
MQDATNSFPRPLLILKAGDTFDSLRATQGDFEHWIADGLGEPTLPVLVLDPRQGDALPAANEISGVVLTGSHSMVSHREPWSERTAAWLAGVVQQDQLPVLGICYGHQLLAHALGGEAGDHPVAMEIGTVDVQTTPAAAQDPLFRALPGHFAANVVHRQSALRLPAGAVRLAGNDFEPHQAFRVGEQAWGVQFHPEFDEEAMRGYVDHLAESLQNPAAVREAVRPTPEAASLLQRFARIVAQRASASESTPALT